MAAASEKVRLITTDIETLRLHYAYTLRHWLERTRKAKAKIVALYDERFFRMWEFYLAGGIVAFEVRRDVQLPAAICPRPPRAADHARLHGRGGGAVPGERSPLRPGLQLARSSSTSAGAG